MIQDIIAVLSLILIKGVNGAYRARYYSYRLRYTHYTYYGGSGGEDQETGMIVGLTLLSLLVIGGIILLIWCCKKSKFKSGRVLSTNTTTVSYINPPQHTTVSYVNQPTPSHLFVNSTSYQPGMYPPPSYAAYPPPSSETYPPSFGAAYPRTYDPQIQKE
ncbi:hypothetical protein SNE40_013715 [Patella caerulea]|uniref:Uncharacterized protein n=1 Tax=Patella caerulea TaxID=87958 RepID=A0AAN8JGP7_PATCE